MYQVDYWTYENERNRLKEFELGELMEKYHREAISAFSGIVHNNFIAEIMASTAYAYENDDTDARNIFHRLYLNEKHAAAINNNTTRLEHLLVEEQAAASESCFN